MLIKLSAAVLAAVGAKTADEFPDALAKLLNDNKAAAEAAAKSVKDLQSSLESANQTAADLKTRLDAAEKTISELSAKVGNPAAITEANVKAWATEAGKAEGSRAATEAVGAIGKGAPPAAPSSAASSGEKTQVEQLVAAGKFEEAFKADKNIQAEFGDAKTYAAYMKNRSRVRISEKKGEK